MKQIVILHGGTSFSSREKYLQSLKAKKIDYDRLLYSGSWRNWIAKKLSNDVDVLLPSLPNKDNASYDEWKIYFEKLLPLLGNDVQLVGHSLGGMFLAKYLQDNPLEKPVRRLIMVAPGYNDDTTEDLGSFRVKSANNLPKSAKQIHFFHSKDDPVVPFSELAKFQKDVPGAQVHVFNNKFHFWDETFPELLKLLKQN